MTRGWIGVDLDGTLAEYHGWEGPTHIGPPVPKMVERVRAWLAKGIEVRVLTARACSGHDPRDVYDFEDALAEWCRTHVGQPLRATAEKDFGMVELWDDRAVQIIPNTGERADGRP